MLVWCNEIVRLNRQHATDKVHCLFANAFIDHVAHDDVIEWKHFPVTGPQWGEFTGEFPSQRPVTRSLDVFFDLLLNKRMSKSSRHRWFETPLPSLWRHCNERSRLVLFRYFVRLCDKWDSVQHIEVETQWLPLFRWHSPIYYFLVWKFLNFYSNLLFLMTWQWIGISSYDDVRWLDIIWTIASIVWCYPHAPTQPWWFNLQYLIPQLFIGSFPINSAQPWIDCESNRHIIMIYAYV